MLSDRGVDNLKSIFLLINLLEAVKFKRRNPKRCTTFDWTPSDALRHSCLVEGTVFVCRM